MKENKKGQQSKICKWTSEWSKFNISLYFKDFNFSIFCWLFVLIAITILFHIPIQNFLNFILIKPILSTCPQNIGVDLIFILIAIFTTYFFFKQLYKHLLPTINSLLFGVTVTILYIVFVKNSSLYTFHHFSNIFTNTTYSTFF